MKKDTYSLGKIYVIKHLSSSPSNSSCLSSSSSRAHSSSSASKSLDFTSFSKSASKISEVFGLEWGLWAIRCFPILKRKKTRLLVVYMRNLKSRTSKTFFWGEECWERGGTSQVHPSLLNLFNQSVQRNIHTLGSIRSYSGTSTPHKHKIKMHPGYNAKFHPSNTHLPS